jgi:hypothetical protein
LIVFIDCLALTLSYDLEGSFCGDLSKLHTYQPRVSDVWLASGSRSSDNFVVSSFFKLIRRQVTLQEATSPCFQVLAILSDHRPLLIGLEPTEHR